MVDRMIHIEGMGLLGSLTALNLAHRGIPFTWNDTDRPFVAWRASTGMVYPAGDNESQRGLAAWKGWITEPWLPAGAAMECEYVYHHKNPPHEGKYKAAYDLGDMRSAPSGNAVAVRAPLLVEHARARFADCRVNQATEGQFVIRAHGFTERLSKVMWGWTVPVKLDLPPDVQAIANGRPVAFYSRRNRFQIVYAYPIGDTGWHWSGSSLVGQKSPHTLNVEKHYERWHEAWEHNFPRVPVIERSESIQGWRPRPADADTTAVQRTPTGLVYPPLWHSGIRWAPNVITQMLEMVS